MNYSSLVSQIQNFSEDDSTELSNEINNIIIQAEEMIFQRLPSLPCFRQQSTGNLVIGTADYTVANARMIRQFSITNSSSSRLLRLDKVRNYLVKVRQQNAEITQRKQDIDRDFLIQEYLDILKLSKDNLQLNTAKNTLDSLAHLAGLWLDKREVTNNVKVDMTLEQLDTNQLIDALQLARHDAIDAPYKLIDDEKTS